MKTVILAGGLGTRLAEETTVRPKPMVEIGGKPILWHIMNIYSAHGYKDFIVACGYKAEIIKEYFSNFMLHNSDLQFDFKTGRRLHRLQSWIGNETFMATYGDGVANVDIKALVSFHRSHGKKATVTAVT